MTARRGARAVGKGVSTLLVGDLGGTSTRLALHERKGRRLVAEAVIPSREHATFDEIALAFLASACAPLPDVVVLGVAGPVQGGAARVTNLPWRLDERALERRLAVREVVLVNDLVASAVGCLHMPASKIVPLTEARPAPRGRNVAVIAAGTGLGEARLAWDGARHLPLGSEGGHADFAPRTPIEVELWHFLLGRHPDHVSYERIVSGDGLGALYDFFASRTRRVPRSIEKRLAEGDRNQAIAELGLARAYRPAALAVDLFASIYGAEAGNLALRELALGGVFVVGNIARSLVPERRDVFLEAFRKKGRFASMLANIPVAVVTDPMVGVRGALAIAEERAALSEARARPPRAP
jgi:glucokinase